LARNLLEVAGLTAAYGRVRVLHDVDLAVSEGEVVAILGPNGAGKSSLLRCVSGLTPEAQSGSISFDGSPRPKGPASHNARAGIVHVPEGRQVFGQLSVLDNLMVARSGTQGRASKRDVRALLEEVYGYFPRLVERRGQKAGTLSGGEQQMLAIGRGLMSEPRLLMIDEPSLGLAPVVVSRLYEALAALTQSRGITLVIVEQIISHALAVADRYVLIQSGRVVAGGAAADVRADSDLLRQYLN
jgi:branched-chain amino acid transport system ATP-binding protein